MATDLMHEATPPLAWDDDEQPFVPPAGTIAWRVRKYTGSPGRPPAVWTPDGILHMSLESTIDQLRDAVGEPGSYRLYPIDKSGSELTPIACIEIVPDDEDDDEDESRGDAKKSLALTVADDRRLVLSAEVSAMADTQGQLLEAYKQMLVSRDKHDELLSQLLTTLVTSTAQIQQSTATLLAAANTTVKVANGVEAIERQEPPHVDVDKLAEVLGDALGGDGKKDTPAWVQLLNGPIGMGLMQFAQGFMKTLAAAQANAAAKAKAEAKTDATKDANSEEQPQNDESDKTSD